jgi:large subunit ribosomal protein LP2
MLAVTGGNDSPNVADCKKILSSVGVELSGDEEKRLEDLVEEMAGTSLAEVLEKGHALLKTIPGGGGGGGGGGAATGGAAPAAEAKKSSSSEDDDAAPMAGGGLFGGDEGDDY